MSKVITLQAARAARSATRNPAPTPEWTAGALVAVELMDDLREVGTENCSIDDRYRMKSTPQRNLVGEYLAKIAPDNLEGFTAMLTEFLVDFEQAAAPTTGWYECLSKYAHLAEQEWAKINGMERNETA